MILNDLLRPLTREVTVKAFEKEKLIRRKYGKGFIAQPPPMSGRTSGNGKNKVAAVTEVKGRVMWVKQPGKDIYGNEKPTDVQYFKCTNCGRKVAGTRFAAHIERCLSGRNSRQRQYVKNGRWRFDPYDYTK